VKNHEAKPKSVNGINNSLFAFGERKSKLTVIQRASSRALWNKRIVENRFGKTSWI